MNLLIRIAQAPEITCDNFPPACIANFSDLFGLLLPIIYAVAALVMLGFLIWAAFKWIQSGGDPQKLAEARKTMTYAIIGVLVIILAWFLTRLVTYIFGVDLPL